MLVQVTVSADQFSVPDGTFDGTIEYKLLDRGGVVRSFRCHSIIGKAPADLVFQLWNGNREVASIHGLDYDVRSERVHALVCPHVLSAMRGNGQYGDVFDVASDYEVTMLALCTSPSQQPHVG